MSEPDHFYLKQEEPVKSCLLALREIILAQDKDITAAWKYGMPFFCYKGKMFCYLWISKKTGQPYIGFVEGKHMEHPQLITEKRARMKILLLDADKDLPLKMMKGIIKEALDLYRNGKVKLKG